MPKMQKIPNTIDIVPPNAPLTNRSPKNINSKGNKVKFKKRNNNGMEIFTQLFL